VQPREYFRGGYLQQRLLVEGGDIGEM
jgi:hypothetical protein